VTTIVYEIHIHPPKPAASELTCLASPARAVDGRAGSPLTPTGESVRTESMYAKGSSPYIHRPEDPLAVHLVDGCDRARTVTGIKVTFVAPEAVTCFDCCALGNGWVRGPYHRDSLKEDGHARRPETGAGAGLPRPAETGFPLYTPKVELVHWATWEGHPMPMRGDVPNTKCGVKTGAPDWPMLTWNFGAVTCPACKEA
jgi:hypothetical protein